jgi:hypothetical protein
MDKDYTALPLHLAQTDNAVWFGALNSVALGDGLGLRGYGMAYDTPLNLYTE